MEQGFTLDTTGGRMFPTHWFRGIPKKSFWTGTKTPDTDGIPIGVFRCSSCGYLELYAGHNLSSQ